MTSEERLSRIAAAETPDGLSRRRLRAEGGVLHGVLMPECSVNEVLQFKQAGSDGEIEQIHRLNHLVFAEEVKQHPQTPDGRLVDKFHERNRYFIASRGKELVGMISVHAGPEFSIESRLMDLSELREMRAPLEVRLLAIRPEFRYRSILLGLFVQVWRYAVRHHYSDLLISGIVQRVPMYAKLGFRPMGEAVPCGAAEFVPMRLNLAAALEKAATWDRLYDLRWGSGVQGRRDLRAASREEEE